ncbi:MAG: hypothetical protein PHU44_01720 [Syntrophales bacterium]|nr:hypothetical protein [Syntrophales bacterium]MDD5643727.1 hypothetical protein [Syntrophales bacterium]
MSAKRILASIFAVVILIKLLFWIIAPNLWMGLVDSLLGHQGLVTIIYLGLLIITGYYAFSTLDFFDIVVVMFFTSILMAIGALPYASLLLKLRDQITGIGIGKAWLALLLWGGLAVAVLYKVFYSDREQSR